MRVDYSDKYRRFSSKVEPVSESMKEFLQEVREWLEFLYYYTRKKLLKGASYFERVKDVLVDFLLSKRGRYSKHFLNTSFLFLIAGAIIGGPVIAEYYPTVSSDGSSEDESYMEMSLSSSSDLSTTTVISEKPRFEIVDYEIVEGDTLGEIAEKFGISVDTIKWANNLKTEKLVPGQKIKIPPVTGIVHKVNAGDTIYSLAKKYQTEAQNIVNFPANDFADLDTFALNIGQILFIPDGVPPKAKPIYRPQPVPRYIADTGGGKFMWPTQGRITQYPVSYHMAVDIANRSAPAVAAGEAGTVSFAGCLRWGYGCHVIINHSNGFQTLYGHLSSFNVSAGQSVGRGQVIGRMGSTGRSSGTHLHFEVRRNGVLLNPLSFL